MAEGLCTVEIFLGFTIFVKNGFQNGLTNLIEI